MSSCKFDFTVGHYEGTLFENKESTVNRSAVTIDVSKEDNRLWVLKVKNAQKQSIAVLTTRPLKGYKIQLTLPTLSDTPFILERNLQDSSIPAFVCYSHSSTVTVKACLSSEQFKIEVFVSNRVSLYSLTGESFKIRGSNQYEPPAQLTLAQTVDRTLHKNIDSQIELEHLIQRKGASHARYLNLLPHISFRSAFLVAALSPLSTPTAVYNLAPFLLPDRWLLARAGSFQAKAQEDAYTILRADLATELEGLAYTY